MAVFAIVRICNCSSDLSELEGNRPARVELCKLFGWTNTDTAVRIAKIGRTYPEKKALIEAGAGERVHLPTSMQAMKAVCRIPDTQLTQSWMSACCCSPV